MKIPDRPLLQLAVDVLTTGEALRIARLTHPHFDILEVGTPLIIEEGLHALTALKAAFPDKLYLADLKIMDAGRIEASSAFRAGADIVTVLGAADDTTIRHALAAAAESGGLIMADLINVGDPARRAARLEELGVPIVCVHTAFDRQAGGENPFDELQAVRAAVGCRVAVAGGMTRHTVNQGVRGGAAIVVVGSAVLRAPDPGAEVRAVMDQLKE